MRNGNQTTDRQSQTPASFDPVALTREDRTQPYNLLRQPAASDKSREWGQEARSCVLEASIIDLFLLQLSSSQQFVAKQTAHTIYLQNLPGEENNLQVIHDQQLHCLWVTDRAH